MPIEAPALLTVREVARALGVSAATVYGLIDRGELQVTRAGSSLRIAPADLAAYFSRPRR